jgi:hypothetical protein
MYGQAKDITQDTHMLMIALKETVLKHLHGNGFLFEKKDKDE